MLKQITAMQKSAWGCAAVFLGAAAGTVVQERQPQLPAGTYAPSPAQVSGNALFERLPQDRRR